MVADQTSKKAEHVYRVVFMNQGEVWEIYARQIAQGGLFGFVEVEELLFGERSQVLIDPSEEKVKTELDGVRRTYIPLHSIVRIDEVEKRGASRIVGTKKGDSNVTSFPLPVFPSQRDGEA